MIMKAPYHTAHLKSLPHIKNDKEATISMLYKMTKVNRYNNDDNNDDTWMNLWIRPHCHKKTAHAEEPRQKVRSQHAPPFCGWLEYKV